MKYWFHICAVLIKERMYKLKCFSKIENNRNAASNCVKIAVTSIDETNSLTFLWTGRVEK